jgi:glutathione S-transferase
MRLYMSTGSPFVRKCRIVLRERGLLSRVEETTIDFPYKTDPGHLATNPIGQVPALIADDGTPYFSSALICDYLDALAGAPRLLPSEGDAHFRVRRQEALADGIMEMTVKRVMEMRRPDGEKSPTWIGHWEDGMARGLDAAEAVAPDASTVDLGAIALAVAATYLEFRRPEMGWRTGRPRLAALTDALEARSSFKETYPA